VSDKKIFLQSGTTDLSFTGMNQDTSTGLYDFLYREYSTQAAGPNPTPQASPPSIPRILNPGTATPTS
jgi:hypothetical protein